MRVCDQYLAIKDDREVFKGLARCIIYLEDMGEVVNDNKSSGRK